MFVMLRYIEMMCVCVREGEGVERESEGGRKGRVFISTTTSSLLFSLCFFFFFFGIFFFIILNGLIDEKKNELAKI